MRNQVFPELANYVFMTCESITDTVFLTEPPRYASAGTAIADCIETLLEFHNGMDKTFLATLS